MEKRNGLRVILALVALAACASNEPVPPDTIERTIVYLQPDGTSRSVTSAITRDEQAREIVDREALFGALRAAGKPIQVDGTCAASSMWMFDQTYNQGNEICFYGSGTAYLNDFVRVCARLCQTWSGAVASYWAGAMAGKFIEPSGVIDAPGGSGGGGDLCPEPFDAYKRVLVAGACGQNAGRLVLY
ncbi:MAG TPA: hypothetical protein VKE22_09035 [Haliangiales bacterium]|nr:hypothetical protein [Haliangiales bacterium]